MTLKTSLFNKGIYKSTLRRYAWGSILYFILLFSNNRQNKGRVDKMFLHKVRQRQHPYVQQGEYPENYRRDKRWQQIHYCGCRPAIGSN